jgi:hypothetical protein
VESIQHSSSNDASIVDSNMSYARRVAKYIVESGRIFEDLDISFPFGQVDLFKRVSEACKELGLQPVQGARVLAEFMEADVIETIVAKGSRKMRFRWKIGSLHEHFGASISSKLEPQFEFTESDMGLNDCDGSTRPPFKGAKLGVVAERKF